MEQKVHLPRTDYVVEMGKEDADTGTQLPLIQNNLGDYCILGRLKDKAMASERWHLAVVVKTLVGVPDSWIRIPELKFKG